MKRRLLSAFLAVMMVLTMAPVAFAADTETTTEYVAQVDGNKYETLADAIKAANDGDTITLLKGGNGNGFKVPEGRFTEQGLTIDFNQFTYMIGGQLVGSAGTGTNGCQLLKNNKITFKNGSFVGATEGSKPADDTPDWHGAPAIMIQNYCDLTLENMIVTGGDETVYTFSNNCGNTVIKDSTINAGKAKGYSSGPFAFDVCRYSTYPSVSVTVQGSSVINGDVEISGTIGAGQSRQLNIEDGIFNGRFVVSNTPANISITGGTFSSDVSAYCDANYVTAKNADNTYTVKPLKDVAVAKVGDTYYKTLAEAVSTADKNTVTLLKNTAEDITIAQDKDITLDLNGKTLTNVNSDTITVNKGATLTINGEGTVDNVTHQKTTIYNKGTVTLNGGTYDRSKEDGIKDSNTYYTLLNHGTMTVANVTVNNKGGYSSLFENGYFNQKPETKNGIANPILTIESGNFTGGINTVKNDDDATMIINDGTFANYAQAAFQNHNIATINGGTFDGSTVYAILNCGVCTGNDAEHDKHQLIINDGKFSGKIRKGNDENGVHYDFGSIAIKGGYFTTDPSAYCVTGKTGVPSNRTDEYAWTVGKKSETKAEVATDKPTVVTKVTATTDEDKTLLEATKTALSSTKVEGNGIATAAAVVANNNTVTADTGVVSQLKEATKDNAVTADNTNIVIQTYMDMTITGVDASSEKKTITVDIQPMYRTVATTADVKNGGEIVLKGDKSKAVNAVQIGNPQKLVVSGETTVSIQLPNGFVTDETAKIFVQHKGYEYEATVTKDENGVYTATFTNPHGFSPFTISMTSQAVAQIGETKYTSLQDAVNAVAANGTIEIIGGTSPYTGTANKTFTVKNGTLADITVNGQPIEPTKSYTFKYTHSSGGSSGGSSSGKTTYKVTTSAVNNGGVNASPSNAEKGATITITLSPDKGYKLDKLTVTDGSGKTVSTVKKSDTVYTFTMPASAVKVGVSYVKATETPSETKFNDVSANDWFASAVDYVTGKGMMNGTADNTFSPKANTTRGMVVTVLYRLENQPSTSAASFTDVASGAYYANAVAWANANGIVSGYGSGKFGPNDKVTREQLAAILYRYAQYKKYDVSVGEDTNILSYDDAQSISSYAIPAIQWACGAGVVTGKSGSKLDPKGNATRAEVAAMLMRFCENVK